MEAIIESVDEFYSENMAQEDEAWQRGLRRNSAQCPAQFYRGGVENDRVLVSIPGPTRIQSRLLQIRRHSRSMESVQRSG